MTTSINLEIGELPHKQRLRRKLRGSGHTYLFYVDENSRPVIVGKLSKPDVFLTWLDKQANVMAVILHSYYRQNNGGEGIRAKEGVKKLGPDGYSGGTGRAGS